jgi:exopolysaccharide biosynthesis predicted pyruvyltransferase EpsI
MHEPWADIIAHLRERQPFVYVHNRGNAGDQLIYKGMLALFRTAGLRYEERRETDNLKGAHVVFSGGGNLTPLYDRCARLIGTWRASLASFTLLPHTVSGHEALLGSLDARFHFFCRDHQSHAHCRQHMPPEAGVSLAPDLALAIEPDAILAREMPPPWMPWAGIDRQLKWRRQHREAFRYVEAGGVAFFRTDKERPAVRRPRQNLDLSAALSAVQKHPAQRIRVADTMLAVLSRARGIATDRLHVAIAGALLGKQTILYDGNNSKVRDVFEYSLAGRFPLVEYAGAFDPDHERDFSFS